MQSPKISKQDNNSLEDVAYQEIKSRILNRTIKPSSFLSVGEIAKELNISRTPVREAIRRLEHEDIVVGEGKRGWKVRGLTIDDINEIYDLRVCLECMVVREAALCSDERKKQNLINALKAMQGKADSKDIEQWWTTDQKYHEAIYDMYQNKRMVKILYNFDDQLKRILIGLMNLEGRIKKATKDHEQMTEHIINGDGEKAAQEMCKHLESARKEIINLVNNFVIPFTDSGA